MSIRQRSPRWEVVQVLHTPDFVSPYSGAYCPPMSIVQPSSVGIHLARTQLGAKRLCRELNRTQSAGPHVWQVRRYEGQDGIA